MGCVYTGFKTNRNKNGFFKVGMTEERYPTARLNAYSLQGIFYLEIPKATKAELLLIESAMRVSVERAGLTLHGNDCFSYLVNRPNKIEQAGRIGQIALNAATTTCTHLGLKYTVHIYKI